MLKRIVKLNDVKEFLLSFGISWSGKFYHPRELEFKEATDENFLEDGETNRKLKLTTFKKTEISFTLFTFYVEGKEYSTEWQSFLLNKYGKEYSKCLYIWSQSMCHSLEERSKTLIQQSIEKHLVDAANAKKTYEQNIAIACKYLTKEEIEELNKL